MSTNSGPASVLEREIVNISTAIRGRGKGDLFPGKFAIPSNFTFKPDKKLYPLQPNSVAPIPLSWTLTFNQLVHVTQKSPAEKITDSNEILGSKSLNVIGYSDPESWLTASWWSVKIIETQKTDYTELIKTNLLSSETKSIENMISEYFSSPAFVEKSRYGNFKFTVAFDCLVENYKKIRERYEVVYRFYGTTTYKQEIMDTVLVCTKDDDEIMSKFPLLDEKLHPIFLTKNGWVWKVKCTGDYYRGWENATFAFYLPEGKPMKIPGILNYVSACEQCEPYISPKFDRFTLATTQNYIRWLNIKVQQTKIQRELANISTAIAHPSSGTWFPGKYALASEFTKLILDRNVCTIQTDFVNFIPSLWELPFQSLSHVTSKSSAENMINSNEILGSKSLNVTGDSNSESWLKASWWSVKVTEELKHECMNIMDNHIFSYLASTALELTAQYIRENYKQKIKLLLSPYFNSLAFSEESKYGNFKFTVPIHVLVENYKKMRDRYEVVYRFYGTTTFESEILDTVIVCTRDDDFIMSKFPMLDEKIHPICLLADGKWIWRVGSTGDKIEDPRNPFGRYGGPGALGSWVHGDTRSWENAAFAFYLPEGKTMQITGIQDYLSACDQPVQYKDANSDSLTVEDTSKIISEWRSETPRKKKKLTESN